MSIPRWSWLIVRVLGVLAVAAVAVTVPAARTAWHRLGPGPAAPGLAALGDDQLLGLLPAPGDFPAGWTFSNEKAIFEDFGYYTTPPRKGPFNFTPQECEGLGTVLSTGAFRAAEVSGDAPAPRGRAERQRIRLIIGREFDPAGFADMVDLVSRCPNSTWLIRPGDEIRYTVRILENTYPDGGPQRFRYALTTAVDGHRTGQPRTEFFSYARVAGLVLSGSGSAGHQQEFDELFDHTLSRLQAG